VQLGAIFPQTEIGTDLGAIGAFVKTVEELGYDQNDIKLSSNILLY
jgi:hypothetical protein